MKLRSWFTFDTSRTLAVLLCTVTAAVSLVFYASSFLICEQALIPDHEPVRHELRAATYSRISALLEWRTLNPDARLGIVLGFSTAREGIDSEIMSDCTGITWANLGTSGSGFHQLSEQAHAVLAYPELGIERVLVGIHPHFLRGRPYLKRTWIGGGVSGRIGKWLEAGWTRVPLIRNRALVSEASSGQLMHLRERFLSFSQLSAQYPPDPQTFAAHRPGRVQQSPQAIAAQLEQFRPLGWFEDAPADAEEMQSAHLRDTVRRLEASEASSVWVFMPECSAMRDLIAESFEPKVRSLLAESAVELVNLRDFLGDNEISDTSHPLAGGRERISARLCGAVQGP